MTSFKKAKVKAFAFLLSEIPEKLENVNTV